MLQLPEYYGEVLNHPSTSDDLRRETESKLFRHKLRHLYALPNTSEKKAVLFAEVDDMASGVVLLGIPDELAWTFVIEGKDCDTIGE